MNTAAHICNQIPESDVERMLGKLVHVGSQRVGCAWRLMRIDGRRALLQTPITKRGRIVDISELYYTYKHGGKKKLPSYI